MLSKKILFSFAIAFLAVSTTLVAQDANESTMKKEKAAKKATAKIFKMFAKAELTDQQQTSAKAIIEKHIDWYIEAKETMRTLLPKDQMAVMKTALKKSRADGLEGAELTAAGLAATQLTEAEQASYIAAKSKHGSISTTIRSEIEGLLTDEQKAALPPMRKGKKNKKRGKGKKKRKKNKDKSEDDNATSN